MIILTNNNRKKKDKKKSHIPFRLNLLFFSVFLLYTALILRLGYLQIVKGEEYEAEVLRTETTLATGNVPRGEIYDAQQRKLVGNVARQSILYTRGKTVSNIEMAELAMKLTEYIDLPHVTQMENEDEYDLTERDLQDFWLVMNEKEVNDRLTDEEKKLSGSELYRTQVSKVTAEDVDFSNEEKEAAAIFKKMNGAYSLTTINIKNEDVTNEEIARVNEHLSELPGVDTGTDWERTYPQGSMLRSILGNVTSEEEGLLSNQLNTYLAQGYARNDRVGKSQLELQYEPILRGTKSKFETETNRQGDVVNQTQQYPGAKGDNLVLTMDIAYQQLVEDIATQSLLNSRQGLNDRIYVGAMDPKTGDILAMTGQRIDKKTGKIVDDAHGFFTTQYSMGSSVKGATVLAGYMDGALTYDDNVLADEALSIRGTPTITSVFNRRGAYIPMNDITALERSSNVYMSKVAMRMGGQYSHTSGAAVSIDGKEVTDKLRRYYAQFGLGVETGIDLPSEATGTIGNVVSAGQALYQSFGQFDTYTSLQLLQYASTIANGGKRMAPRLVSEIRDTNDKGELGTLKTEIHPRLLNTVNVDERAMERVREGFYRVVNGNGSARSTFAGAAYRAAGKTGTAEAFYYEPGSPYHGQAVINKTFVSYAPHDDPEIAVVVVVPWLPINNTNYENTQVARRVMDAYFQVGEYANQPTQDEVIDESSDDSIDPEQLEEEIEDDLE